LINIDLVLNLGNDLIDHCFFGEVDAGSDINTPSSPPSASPLSSIPIKVPVLLTLCTGRAPEEKRLWFWLHSIPGLDGIVVCCPFPTTTSFLVTLRSAATPQLHSRMLQKRIRKVEPGRPPGSPSSYGLSMTYPWEILIR
jgi:hypothetical protein